MADAKFPNLNTVIRTQDASIGRGGHCVSGKSPEYFSAGNGSVHSDPPDAFVRLCDLITDRLSSDKINRQGSTAN